MTRRCWLFLEAVSRKVGNRRVVETTMVSTMTEVEVEIGESSPATAFQTRNSNGTPPGSNTPTVTPQTPSESFRSPAFTPRRPRKSISSTPAKHDPSALDHDWNMAMVRRRLEMVALQEGNKTESSARALGGSLMQPLKIASTYVNDQVPWQKGISVVEELNQGIENLRSAMASTTSPPPLNGVEQTISESPDEGFLDENCQPFRQ